MRLRRRTIQGHYQRLQFHLNHQRMKRSALLVMFMFTEFCIHSMYLQVFTLQKSDPLLHMKFRSESTPSISGYAWCSCTWSYLAWWWVRVFHCNWWLFRCWGSTGCNLPASMNTLKKYILFKCHSNTFLYIISPKGHPSPWSSSTACSCIWPQRHQGWSRWTARSCWACWCCGRFWV